MNKFQNKSSKRQEIVEKLNRLELQGQEKHGMQRFYFKKLLF